jgi:hypothetical protein
MSRRFVVIALGILIVVVVLVMMFSSAMLQGNYASRAYSSTVQSVYATNSSVAVALSNTQVAMSSGEQDQATPQNSSQRMVIKDATLRLTVNNPQETLNSITRLADEMGGWVVNSNSYQTTNRSGTPVTQATVAIRIPAQRLTEALERIKAGAVSIDQEEITGKDVTREYTDLSSQLTNLEAAEAQLRKIMESTTKTDDVLAVYRELTRVRGDIEVAKGQLQYYKEAAAFSSVSVTLVASEQDKPIEIGGWRPLDTAKSAVETLANLLQGLINLLIWLAIVVLPFVLIFGLPTWLVYRIARRRRARAVTLEPTLPDAEVKP